jgi:hypothetical protein
LFSPHSAGTAPALMRSFSWRELRWRGTSTIVASMIDPVLAPPRLPVWPRTFRRVHAQAPFAPRPRGIPRSLCSRDGLADVKPEKAGERKPIRDLKLQLLVVEIEKSRDNQGLEHENHI